MAEKYELSAEDLKYEKLAKEALLVEKKHNRNEKKRKREQRKLELKRKDDKPNNLSKKDEVEVELWINKNMKKVHKVTVSSKGFNGTPGEYEKIKLKCEKELNKRKIEVNWMNIKRISDK